MWSLLFCISRTSIFSSSMAVRTARQRRWSSASEIGELRRSDKAMVSVFPGCRLAHDVDHGFEIAGKKFSHIAGDGRHRSIFVTLRITAEMRKDRQVFRLPQWIVGRQRLLRKDIEAGTGDFSCLEGSDQSRLIDDAAARDIDQVSRRLHRRKDLRADNIACFGAQWREHDEKIEIAGHLGEFVAVRHSVEVLGFTRAAADTDNVQAKGLADRREIFGDQSDPENADGLACE